jgi:hypothetical protein
MPFPLYSEISDLTSAVESTDFVLPVDTTYRDIWTGQRVLVFEPVVSSSDPTERINKFSIGRVFQIASDSLTLFEEIGQDFSAGAFVIPLIEADIELSQQGAAESGEVVSLTFSATEIAGVTTLPGTDVNPRHPISMQTFQRKPVWTESLDWSEPPSIGIERAGIVEQRYQGTLTTPKEFPRSTFEFLATFDTRDQLWRMQQFFDFTSGRLQSFWLVDPICKAFVQPVVWSDYIAVRSMGDLEGALAYGIAIAVRDTDGAVDLGLIDYVEELAGPPKIWKFRFKQGTAPQPPNGKVESVTFAHMVRFADDELVVEYVTNSVVRTTLRFIEVGDENFKAFDFVST